MYHRKKFWESGRKWTRNSPTDCLWFWTARWLYIYLGHLSFLIFFFSTATSDVYLSLRCLHMKSFVLVQNHPKTIWSLSSCPSTKLKAWCLRQEKIIDKYIFQLAFCLNTGPQMQSLREEEIIPELSVALEKESHEGDCID